MYNLLNFLPEQVFDTIYGLPDFAWNIILILIAVSFGLIVRAVTIVILNFYYKRSDFFLVRSIVKHLGTPAAYFLPFLMINFAMPFLRLSKVNLRTVDKIIEIALTISIAVILIRTTKIFEDIVYYKYDLNKTDNLRERKIRTQLQFIRKFVIMLIVLLTAAAILLSFENLRKVGAGLLTGVGVGGVIIGFAAQKSLGNLLAGFQIAFTQPIRLDDVLVVEGEWGRVEEITLTYVVLRIWDQRRLILPINYFIEKPFQNWTRISSEILGTVFLYLDYSVPVEKLRMELKRLLENHPLWDGKVCVMQVTDTKERTIEIRALVSASNSGNAFDLRCYVREKLIAFVQENYPESLPKTRTEVLGNPAEGQVSFPHGF